MVFRLVEAGWDEVLFDAIREDRSIVQLICPFIKKRSVERLLHNGKPGVLQVITRFHLGEFCDGVSDITALRLLMQNGATIRGVRNLHAKLYLFGERQAIVTSANLTEAALLRYHEFGFVSEDAGIMSHCRQYFENLWSRAGQNLSAERLAEWNRKVTNHLTSGARPAFTTRLGDEGVEVGITSDPITFSALVGDAGQAFVKFFGINDNRAERTQSVLEEVRRSGCHWACTYPKGKRPRKVQDGAIMFMGRLVKEPNDILVFGRAVGIHHEPDRDDATHADLALRPWKEKWPHYIRVHHAEFIAGNLENGISVTDLMESLRSDAFVPTQRNAARGEGNTNPRLAYRRQPAVELTPQAIAWLNERLEFEYAHCGKVAPDDMDQLDWPKNQE